MSTIIWSRQEVTLLRLPVISRLLYFLTKAGSLAGALGIEPKLTESKSVVLPLHNTPTMFLVRLVRLELTRLSARVSKTRMATNYITTACLVGIAGFEPATTCTPCKYATGLRYIPLVPLLRFELRELLLLREMTLPICPQGHWWAD